RNAKALLLVLVSPETPEGLNEALRAAPGKLLTLGPADSKPRPTVMVGTDAKADRLAYDAFENGIPISTLISGKVEKERFDEATLVKEFRDGNPYAEPPPPSDPTNPDSEASPDKK